MINILPDSSRDTSLEQQNPIVSPKAKISETQPTPGKPDTSTPLPTMTQQTNINSTPSHTQPLLSSKKSSKLLYILAGGFVLVVLLVISVLFFMISKSNSEIISSDDETHPVATDLSNVSDHLPDSQNSTIIPISSEKYGDLPVECYADYDYTRKKFGQSYDDCRGKVTTCDDKTVTQKQKNLIIILDVSGSMNAELGGRTRMEIAKDSVINYVNSLPEDVNVGLIVYGHKGNNTQAGKAASCSGIDETYYLGALNKKVFEQKVRSFQPTGWTPIAAALKNAQQIVQQYPSDQYINEVVLVSDGQETCGGDPVSRAKEFRASNTGLVTNIIGFDVSGADEAALRSIAQSGGGTYTSAKNSEDFWAGAKSLLYQELECVQVTIDNNESIIKSGLDCDLRTYDESLAANDFTYDQTHSEISENCRAPIRKQYYIYMKQTRDEIEKIRKAQKQQAREAEDKLKQLRQQQDKYHNR